MNNYKKELLEVLTRLKNNFNYQDIQDYQIVILLYKELLSNNEQDQDILNIINEIFDNIEKNNKKENEKIRKVYIQDFLNNKREDLTQTFSNSKQSIQRALSYRIVCPKENKPNYSQR